MPHGRAALPKQYSFFELFVYLVVPFYYLLPIPYFLILPNFKFELDGTGSFVGVAIPVELIDA